MAVAATSVMVWGMLIVPAAMDSHIGSIKDHSRQYDHCSSVKGGRMEVGGRCYCCSGGSRHGNTEALTAFTAAAL